MTRTPVPPVETPTSSGAFFAEPTYDQLVEAALRRMTAAEVAEEHKRFDRPFIVTTPPMRHVDTDPKTILEQLRNLTMRPLVACVPGISTGDVYVTDLGGRRVVMVSEEHRGLVEEAVAGGILHAAVQPSAAPAEERAQ